MSTETCTTCGTPLDSTGRCPKCSQLLETPKLPAEPKPGKAGIVVGCLFLLVCVGIFLYLVGLADSVIHGVFGPYAFLVVLVLFGIAKACGAVDSKK